jgi:hypothetical protein
MSLLGTDTPRKGYHFFALRRACIGAVRPTDRFIHDKRIKIKKDGPFEKKSPWDRCPWIIRSRRKSLSDQNFLGALLE